MRDGDDGGRRGHRRGAAEDSWRRRDLHAGGEAGFVRRRACPGTLSFDAVRWSHDRVGAHPVLAGLDRCGQRARDARASAASGGTAGHGSTSPWDIHNTLIAAGPDVKRGVSIAAPSVNADLAPTLLKVMGLPIPASMDGRVLDEALANGKPLSAGDVRPLTHVVRTLDGGYTLTGAFSVVRSGGREFTATSTRQPWSGSDAGVRVAAIELSPVERQLPSQPAAPQFGRVYGFAADRA